LLSSSVSCYFFHNYTIFVFLSHFPSFKIKFSLCFNLTPRHECVLGEWRCSFTPRPLYPQGKSPWYPLDRRLGGSQGRSGRGSEEKNSQPLPGREHPDHPARSPAIYRWAILASFMFPFHPLCVCVFFFSLLPFICFLIYFRWKFKCTHHLISVMKIILRILKPRHEDVSIA
jgi:hypothetical protein